MDNLNNKGTILFVDDEQIVLDVGTMMIKKLGYWVLQATSGTEASQVFSDILAAINSYFQKFRYCKRIPSSNKSHFLR